MAFQILRGITVEPKDKNRWGRIWVPSYAFGGWIYGANVEFGFHQKPTTVTLSITLSNEGSQLNAPLNSFDISQADLKLVPDVFGNDEAFSFNIGLLDGIKLTHMYLFSYEKSIKADSKTLKVTFKDYSTILDKIYIGLFKSQGFDSAFIRHGKASVTAEINCPDCDSESLSIFPMTAKVETSMRFCSYVGMGGSLYDNFEGIAINRGAKGANPAPQGVFALNNNPPPAPGGIFGAVTQSQTPPTKGHYEDVKQCWKVLHHWAKFGIRTRGANFNMSGGFLILGAEDFQATPCGDKVRVSYSFSDLIASLIRGGMMISSNWPQLDRQIMLRRDYIGTLRDVLQKWGSEFAFDFTFQRNVLCLIDLTKNISVDDVSKSMNPANPLGASYGDIDGQTVIEDFSESYSLENTYSQTVVTSYVKPKRIKSHNKSLKVPVGFLPIHPLNFMEWSKEQRNLKTSHGLRFKGMPGTYSFSTFEKLNNNKHFFFTHRKRDILTTSIALGKYNNSLRDIYNTFPIFDANADPEDVIGAWRSLSFEPISEITGSQTKASILQTLFKGDRQDNIVLPQYYKMFVGYYEEENYKNIVDWEKRCADNMFKLGALVKGPKSYFPYTYIDSNSCTGSKDLAGVGSDSTGFLPGSSQQVLKTTHRYSPDANRYPYYSIIDEPPWSPVLIHSGIKRDLQWFYASLDNEWGKTEEEFKRETMFTGDACKKFGGIEDIKFAQGMKNTQNSTYDVQTWTIEDFAPKFIADFNEFSNDPEFLSAINNVTHKEGNSVDRFELLVTDLDLKGKKEGCRKLHLFVAPDPKKHPNFKLEISYKKTRNLRMFRKLDKFKYDAEIRLGQEKCRTVCDDSFIDLACRNGTPNPPSPAHPIPFRNQLDRPASCIPDPLQSAWSYAGFPEKLLKSDNCLGISCKITRNPISVGVAGQIIARDENGFFLIETGIAGQSNGLVLNLKNPLKTESKTAEIQLPVGGHDFFDVFKQGNPNADITYYEGSMETTTEREDRIGEIIEIYGAPPNQSSMILNNVAGVRVISSNIPQALEDIIEPNLNSMQPKIFTLDGTNLETIQSFHQSVEALENQSLRKPHASFSISIPGEKVGALSKYLSPTAGLESFNVTIGDGGVKVTLSFADRPRKVLSQDIYTTTILPRTL